MRRRRTGPGRAWLGSLCVLCGDPAGPGALCPPCLADLPPLGPACAVCALPRVPGAAACGACAAGRPPWHGATAPLRYGFPVDVLVHRLKFRGDLAAGAALAEAMCAGALPALEPGARPWLVPVPLHWTRELRRGFNQAMELALPLERYTGWALRPRWLKRVRRTPPQSRLAHHRRGRDLRRAFRWRGPALAGRCVVLVDDVLTSGATAAACTRSLVEAGAASVDLWVAARALPANVSANVSAIGPAREPARGSVSQSARRAQRS